MAPLCQAGWQHGAEAQSKAATFERVVRAFKEAPVFEEQKGQTNEAKTKAGSTGPFHQ
jgi:hypothetical protein